MNYELLTADEQQTIAYVWNGDSISNIVLQQLLGLNSIEAGKLLHMMVEKGLLNQNNKNRWTTYTILKKLEFENGEEKSKEKSKEKGKAQLSSAESSVLRLLHQNPRHTYETLKQSLGYSVPYIYKILNQLKRKKVVRREGGRKEGFWVVLDSEV